MIDYHVALGALAGVTLASLGGSILLAGRVRSLSRRIRVLQQGETKRGNSARPSRRSDEAETEDFAPLLAKSRIRSRLQERGACREAPGKYRHVVSLMDHGMGAAQIAEILTLSPEEAAQLIALARAGPLQAGSAGINR
jgi:DNA-directed RNA polymerase specialized sigma24 family protein